MPIYEYKCKGCDLEFEVMQRFSDEPIKKCEQCGGDVEKLISLSSFHLKGGGWYATEYGNKKNNKDKKEGGGKDAPKCDVAEPKAKPDCKGCPSSSE
jgi:putative FmdB family regulatory protein